MLCKHLFQAVNPVDLGESVDPVFFQQVTRNRTVPFWTHRSFKSLNPRPMTETTQPQSNQTTSEWTHARREDVWDPEEEMGADSNDDFPVIDMDAGRGTFNERLNSLLSTLRDFSDRVVYQRQFQDSRILDVLEREGASFFLRLALED
ncbi:hypothetical protein B0H19DRAFT_1274404 [Mycena capillaripes]|nr:hypothetical protein B0H19DRAFT_1274404 [Mycena capillaripes]